MLRTQGTLFVLGFAVTTAADGAALRGGFARESLLRGSRFGRGSFRGSATFGSDQVMLRSKSFGSQSHISCRTSFDASRLYRGSRRWVALVLVTSSAG